MNYYAVIDTNVIVSSFLVEKSIPDQIVNLALNGPIVPLLNEEIIKEYKDVLLRNKFNINEKDVIDFINKIVDRSILLERTITEKLFIDKEDAVFYEITLTGRKDVDAYLITGNKKHFPSEPFVVTPREMLDIIKSNEQPLKNS